MLKTLDEKELPPRPRVLPEKLPLMTRTGHNVINRRFSDHMWLRSSLKLLLAAVKPIGQLFLWICSAIVWWLVKNILTMKHNDLPSAVTMMANSHLLILCDYNLFICHKA